MKKSSLTEFLSKPVNFYYMLLGSTLILTFMGLIMVFSASSIHSLGTKGNSYGIVLRQALALVGRKQDDLADTLTQLTAFKTLRLRRKI